MAAQHSKRSSAGAAEHWGVEFLTIYHLGYFVNTLTSILTWLLLLASHGYVQPSFAGKWIAGV